MKSRALSRSFLLAAALVLGACAGPATSWSELPRPWTAEIVDRQARVRIALVDGRQFELARPALVDSDAGPALTWRGAGPDEALGAHEVALERIREMRAASSSAAAVSGDRVVGAGLVALGVILWIGLLAALFG